MARSRIAAGLRGSVVAAVTPARLLLAAKTGAAVAAAMLIAPHMPGSVDDYPYYAPLGVLISMYPTLMGSVRSVLQTLFGLAVGIALAMLVIFIAVPAWWIVPLAVAAGVLVSGTGWFGAGQEYVPIAILFVLIIGGSDAEDYSLGYLTQMLLGAVIGLLVNVIVPPAPLAGAASAQIAGFQQKLSTHLEDIAAALRQSWPPEIDEWARDAGSLVETSRAVQDALAAADDSKRANPRAWLRRVDTTSEHARLEALDAVAHHVRDISECLADTIWERPAALPLDPALVEPMSAACHAVSTAVADAGSTRSQYRTVRAEAARAVRVLVEVVDDRTAEARTVIGPGALTAMHLRRILILTAPSRFAGR